MPWFNASMPASEAGQAWQTVFKNSFLRGLSARRLEEPLKSLYVKHRARPGDIANILIGFRATPGGADNPLLFSYAELLLKARYMSTSDLLLALLRTSNYRHGNADDSEANRKSGMPSCEERIFNLLTQYHLSSELPTTALEIQSIVHAIIRWLNAISEYEMGKQLEGGGLHTVDAFSYGIYEALGALAVSVFGNQSIRAVMKQRWWKERRPTVVSEMESFDTHILQWMNSQLAGRLRTLATMPPFIELDKNGRPVFTDQQILNFVPELPVVHSRAGLFVWLNAALVARPLTDDMTILSYLHGRYPGDTQNLIVNLLVASFDVLTNAMLRKESRQNVKVIRSFICNKIPVLISMLLQSSAPPMAADAYIQMALIPGGMISMDPLPPITAGAADIRDSLKSTRMELLQACALHGLLTESTIAAVLQEAVALPRVTKYNKDSLVAQCANNITRLEGLIDDLESMQGNAGAIAGCIVETVGNLCMSKDTMQLKSVCNELVKKIPSMDIVMQYAQPGMLLLPLCTLLNEWMHDQDQTEFTPAYEEFASILLLTLAVIYRYGLDWSEIGLLADNFVSKLLDEMIVSKPLHELSAEQGSQLTKWIEGLFAVDEHGETSGIGDDVMKQCSPQAFYQLVPTLFQQSVLACSANALKLNTFKGGLELLLEPFLLPSLIMGLGWLTEHSWEDHNDAEVLLQVLEKLLKPCSSSQDTQAMHKAVLSMVASPLFHSLQDILHKHPEKKKATELSNLLKPYLDRQRTLKCHKEEIDEWVQSDGDLGNRIQHSIRDLITWAATSSNPPDAPPRYTYREFAVACELLDSEVLLRAIVQELTQTLNAPIALDVCTTIICAPTSVPMGTQQASHSTGPTGKLRKSVRLIGSNAQGLLDKPRAEAEVLVRLARRVEAQLSVTQLPPMTMSMQINDQTAAEQMMQDLGLELPSDATNNNPTVDTTMNQGSDLAALDQQLDLSNPSNQDLANMAASSGAMEIDQSNMLGDLDFGMTTQQSNQQVDLNQEEDIFAGLDMGMEMGDLGDDDFNFG